MSSKAVPPPAIISNTHNRHTKRYKVGKHLGTGGFANVYKVESLDSHREYACKVINKCRLKRREHQIKLVSEIKLHRTLSHHHICKFFHHFDDDDNVYMLLEICTNKSLMELSNERKILTEPEVRYFMKQIIVAIKYLHNNHIIHRDLKLGNILLDKDLIVKLCDFGLAARIKDDERKTTICGTPNYIAPEILNQNKLGLGHSYEVDIWSLGVIMFTLLAGYPPFQTRNLHETYRRIRKMRYQWPESHSVSWMARDLISNIFTDPSQRLNLSEIESHDFFTKSSIPRHLPLSILHSRPSTASLINLNGNRSDPCSATENVSPNIESTKPLQSECKQIRKPLITKGVQQNESQNANCNEVTCTENEGRKNVSPRREMVRIVKYCDYTKKYGIGYLLNNGQTGIYFNDSSKITLHSNHQDVSYHEENGRTRHCSTEQYPESLTKKVKLLYFFARHLWSDEDRDSPEWRRNRSQFEKEKVGTVHVTTFRKEKHGMVFKLSAGVMQVMFADESQLVYENASSVMYRDKNGLKSMWSLEEINQSEQVELKKRYRVMKRLIANIHRRK